MAHSESQLLCVDTDPELMLRRPSVMENDLAQLGSWTDGHRTDSVDADVPPAAINGNNTATRTEATPSNSTQQSGEENATLDRYLSQPEGDSGCVLDFMGSRDINTAAEPHA